MERFCFALAIACVAIACNPKSLRPNYCHVDMDCPMDRMCGPKFMCVERNDGSVDKSEAGDGADARDGGDAEVKFHCSVNTQCADGGVDGGPAVCEPDAGICVECLMNDHCMTKPKTPICEALMCRACKADSECPDPGICMTDGHCATSGEVIFVEFKSSGCAGADGSSANPYCAPNDGVAALDAVTMRRVIVIRGPANGQMTLNTTAVAAVVIGRRNAGGTDPSIPAIAAMALQVSSGDALVRDIAVVSGTSPGSKGIVATGSLTKLTLVNVQVNLGMGLGIQADTGAQLVMDRCTVTNNSVGGLLINGAGYDIQNSIFAANGYGVQFNAPRTPSQFRFNTVVGTVAAFCELNNPQMLSDSIVVGTSTNCLLPNSVTTMPSFKSSPPYHLTGPTACPMTPASPVPDHDVDNEPRTAPLDCGADEF